MGKAITEIDSYAGPMSGTTKLPVSDSDTLQAGTASQVLTYIVANLGNAATKNTGTTAGTVAAGDHTHSIYAATGAIGSSGLTMATAKLLGRSTAGTGAPEEITLGTNLSFSGTTLNAAGGGGSPAGTGTEIQYRNAGSFGAASGTSWDDANKQLQINSYGTTPQSGTSATQTALVIATSTGVKKILIGGYNSGWCVVSDHLVANTQVNTNNILSASGYWKIENSTGLSFPYAAGYVGFGASGSIDIAMQRSGAGVAELNSGSAGTFRDLKLRNLIASGGLATGIVSKNASYTATPNDHTITVDASGGAVTITGYACSGNAGSRLTIKKTDSSANAVTFDPNASETVDGASTKATSTQYGGFTVQVNAAGTAWVVVATF